MNTMKSFHLGFLKTKEDRRSPLLPEIEATQTIVLNTILAFVCLLVELSGLSDSNLTSTKMKDISSEASVIKFGSLY